MNTIPRRTSMNTATVVAAPAPAIPAVAATDDSGVATGAVTGGTFAWGSNATFLGHLASPMAGGRVTGTGGADFVNAENSTIGPQGNAVIALDGGADLKVYGGPGPDDGGGLDLLFDDLVPEVEGTSATLTGDHDLSGSRTGGTEPTVGETGDDAALITFTRAESFDPATGGFSATQVGTFAAPGVTDSLGRYEVGTGMVPASLDLSFAERGEPAPSSADGSSSGGPGLVASFAAPGGILAPVTGAPGSLPGLQLPS